MLDTDCSFRLPQSAVRVFAVPSAVSTLALTIRIDRRRISPASLLSQQDFFRQPGVVGLWKLLRRIECALATGAHSPSQGMLSRREHCIRPNGDLPNKTWPVFRSAEQGKEDLVRVHFVARASSPDAVRTVQHGIIEAALCYSWRLKLAVHTAPRPAPPQLLLLQGNRPTCVRTKSLLMGNITRDTSEGL